MLTPNANLNKFFFKVNTEVSSETNKIVYNIRYETNLVDYKTSYKVRYITEHLVTSGDQYTIRNTYEYSDKITKYIVKYASGREVVDYSRSYRIKYISDNPVNVRQIYRVLFDSEVRLTDIVQVYKVRYTSWGLNDAFSEYNIRYLSVGVGDSEHRKRWSIKYNSQSLGDFATTYKIKYTASVFYDNAIRYLVRYNSQGAEKILTRAALVERDDGKFDAILQIRGTLDYSIDSYFFVLANMPKYQHVEYTIGDVLPYVDHVAYYEVNDIFGTENNGRYEVKGYLVLKDIDPRNSVSIDVYDNTEYKRANRAKSYFFRLDQIAWESVNIEFKDRIIKKINYASDNYEYNYLNFVSTEITPVFNPGDNCCFSRKILPPGSPNISGGCSPF